MIQIESDAQFIGVVMVEKKTFFWWGEAIAKWTYLARGVTARFFNLDNRCSQISQKLGAKAGLLIRQVKDTNAFQYHPNAPVLAP